MFHDGCQRLFCDNAGPSVDVGCWKLNMTDSSLTSQSDRAPRNARLGRLFVDVTYCDLLTSRIVRCAAKLTVTPGTVGYPAFADDHPGEHAAVCSLADADYATVKQRQDGWTLSVMTLRYDNRLAIELALKRRCPEQVHSPSTG